jgi:Domain of unknown function (DUF6089)
MKFFLVAFLLLAKTCLGQEWQAEVMVGISGYGGDLTQPKFPIRGVKPAFAFNLKCELGGMFVLRGGIAYGKVSGDDKYNKDKDLVIRNLNFQTNIIEGSLCMELNLFESDLFKSYPYIFGGVGVYHFNPYTFDKDNKKVFLQPLGTEGQGLSEYPDKKPYSRTQFCIPFGGGFKWNFNKKLSLIFEMGYRYIFTDYLDDVSGTYADHETMLIKRGPTADELAYRQLSGTAIGGDIRGNPKVKDFYSFSGLKLQVNLGGRGD